MSKNVMIPLSLLERVIELLDGLDVSNYGYNFCCEHESVLRWLKVKMQRLELRKAYARIICAQDDEARVAARIRYLQQRRQVGNVDVQIY